MPAIETGASPAPARRPQLGNSGTGPASPGGFTLIELMIVVVVTAILLAIAIPSYMDYVRKARRADAFDGLLRIQALQEKHRASNPAYGATLAAIGFNQSTSFEGFYQLSLTGSITATAFTAQAAALAGTSQAADTGCTTLSLAVNPTFPGGFRAPADCW